MKRLLSFLMLAALMFYSCSSEYDDSELNNRVDGIEQRVQKLETLCSQMNTNISSLQSLVAALQEGDYITSVTSINEGEKVIGYTITFLRGEAITIYHGNDGKDGTNGNDGQDGADGNTPQIGVKQETDGMYYWTVDGEWLLDDAGKKVKAVSTDGQNGTDGITPKLKIENGYWYVSYDGGSTYEQLSAATASDEGENCLFKNVTVGVAEIVFELADGTAFTMPRYVKTSIHINAVDNATAIAAGETIKLEYTLENVMEETFVTASSDGNYVVSVEEAEDGTSGLIYVTAPTVYKDGFINVIVSDAGGNSSVTVINFYEREVSIDNGQNYNVAAETNNMEIPLAINYEYDIELSDGAKEWLTVTKVASRATTYEDKLVIEAKRNETDAARSATIEVIPTTLASRGILRITIIQAAAYFNVDKSCFVVSSEGGEFSTNVKTSRGLSYVVPKEYSSWIKADTTYVDEKNYVLNLSVTANGTGEHRTGYVSLYDDEQEDKLAELVVAQWVPVMEDKEKMIFTCLAYPAQSYKVAIPIAGSVDCYIDWGDGSELEYVRGNYTSYEHTYSGLSEATSFDITVTGTVNKLIASNHSKITLTGVKQWGDTGGLTALNLSGCTMLTSIPADEAMAFASLTNLSGAFQNCSSLTAVPKGLFDACSQVTSFAKTFYNCTSIASIPENLFVNCSNATNYSDTFYGCSSLTVIPENLFANNNKGTTFGGIFSGCSSLTAIPENLFANCVNATAFNSAFHSCSSLAAIPEGLFANNTKVTTFRYAFNSCSSLTAIPEGLFKNCTKVTEFSGTFEYASAITSIPEGLFVNNTEVTNFGAVFGHCSSLVTIPEKLFVNCTKVKDFHDVFNACPNIAAIPEKLFASCPEVTTFAYAFCGASKVTSIPVGLFDKNRKVTDFRYALAYCYSLTSESPYTEINGVKYHLYERSNSFTEFVSPIITQHCFYKSTSLSDYANIPNAWK